MNKYIKIPQDIEFDELTVNQILMLIYLCSKPSVEDLKKFRIFLYNKRVSVGKSDIELLANKYASLIDSIYVSYNHNITNKNDKYNGIKYYKIKSSTFDFIIKNRKELGKHGLLVVLHLIKLYIVNYKREHIISINRLREVIFKNLITTNLERYYNKIIIDNLKLLQSWKYDDGSVFIKSFEIKNKSIFLNLDKSSKLKSTKSKK